MKDRVAPSLAPSRAPDPELVPEVRATHRDPHPHQEWPARRPIGVQVLTAIAFVAGAGGALYSTLQFNELTVYLGISGAYQLLGWSALTMLIACGLAGSGRVAWLCGAAVAVGGILLTFYGVLAVAPIPKLLPNGDGVVDLHAYWRGMLRIVLFVAILIYLLIEPVREYFGVESGSGWKGIAGLAVAFAAAMIALRVSGGPPIGTIFDTAPLEENPLAPAAEMPMPGESGTPPSSGSSGSHSTSPSTAPAPVELPPYDPSDPNSPKPI